MDGAILLRHNVLQAYIPWCLNFEVRNWDIYTSKHLSPKEVKINVSIYTSDLKQLSELKLSFINATKRKRKQKSLL